MNHTEKEHRKGLYLVLLSSSCYGFMPVFTQLAFRSGMPTLTVVFSRYGLAAVLYLLHLKNRKIGLKISKNQFVFLMVLGFLGAASTYGMNESYRYLPSGIATVMTMTYIVIIVLCEILLDRERAAPFRLACLALAFSGILLILLTPGETGGVSARGIFLGLLGAVFYAFQVMAVNTGIIRDLDPEVIFLYESIPLLGCCVLIAFSAGGQLLPADLPQFGHVLLLAVVNSFIAMLSFYKAVRLIGASNASLFGTAEPLVSCIAGAVIMGDALSFGNFSGGVMIVGSILILELIDKKNETHRSRKDSESNNE